MFGDHLPTMGLQNSDMKSGDIYKTKYITWNNMGLPKEDADLYAYQLLAQTTDTVGIHEGTIMNYHQTQMNSTDEASYQDGLDLLQYDILYGKRYCYNGTDLYPASDLVMGIDKVDITSVSDSSTGDTVSGQLLEVQCRHIKEYRLTPCCVLLCTNAYLFIYQGTVRCFFRAQIYRVHGFGISFPD